MSMVVTRAMGALAMVLGLCACGKPSRRGDGAARLETDAAVVAAVQTPALTIVHGSDLRGRDVPDDDTAEVPGGLARRATLVDRVRVASDALIQVDAGDFLPELSTDGGISATAEHRASRIFAAYGRMGVDVITPGERELAFGPERLRAWLKEHRITAVAANLTDAAGARLFEADHLIVRGGRKVGVFGVLDRLAPGAAGATSWKTGDAVDAARRSAHALRERGADLVVALIHTDGGRQRVQEIVGAYSEIDLVVLGHGEGATPPSSRVGHTEIVYAAAGQPSLGRVDVSWANGETPLQLRSELTPLARSVPEQLGVGLLAAIDREAVRRDQEAFAHPKKLAKGAAAPATFETWEYGSNGACVLCHMAAVEHWKTTRHAGAIATLQREGEDKDAGCLGCHLTGYLQPGGSQRLAIATAQFANVGCESCHGPSALHVRSINKKKGTSRRVAETVCLGCHTSERAAFDYDDALKRVLGPGHGAP